LNARLIPECLKKTDSPWKLMKMKYPTVVIAACVLLSGCASMSIGDAMRACDRGKDFNNYPTCLQTTYDKKGDGKMNAAIRAFYGYVKEIGRAYKEGWMTRDQAMDQVYFAYQNTVKSSDDGYGIKTCAVVGAELKCQ
jgi:hypothetical protein